MRTAKSFLIPHFSILAILTLHSCAPKYEPYTGQEAFISSSGQPDYSSLEYWASHPLKTDPADSVPKPLRSEAVSQLADVFFLHPTTLTDERDTSQDNARIDDPNLNKKTDYSSILYQASVFNASCRIYAPRYRQVHYRMYFMEDTLRAKRAFELAYQDVRAAFIYYLQHYNQGRPIVLASHSQGTTHAKRLLAEFFDQDSGLRSQFVCAYMLGIPVKKDSYSRVPPCSSDSSTACFIGWRTYREGYQDAYVSASDSSVTVINPYSWTSDQNRIPKQQHQGAVLYKFNKVFRQTQSARISGNALLISKPKFPGSFLYKTRNYHAGDINLFYLDIRQNVQKRINTYLKQHSEGQTQN